MRMGAQHEEGKGSMGMMKPGAAGLARRAAAMALAAVMAAGFAVPCASPIPDNV
jgi:hypothetical protein